MNLRRTKISSFSSTSISSDYISETGRSLTRLGPSDLWNLIPWKGKCWRCIIYVWFTEQAFSRASVINLWKCAECRNGQRWTRKRKMCNQLGIERSFYTFILQTLTLSGCDYFFFFLPILTSSLIVWKLWACCLLFNQIQPWKSNRK